MHGVFVVMRNQLHNEVPRVRTMAHNSFDSCIEHIEQEHLTSTMAPAYCVL